MISFHRNQGIIGLWIHGHVHRYNEWMMDFYSPPLSALCCRYRYPYSSAITTMSTPTKLRILCLHGMVQNGTIFRKKTAVLRKKLDKIADLGKYIGQWGMQSLSALLILYYSLCHWSSPYY